MIDVTIDSVDKNPTTAPSPNEVVYPDSDGKPIGETGIHVKTILHLHGALTGEKLLSIGDAVIKAYQEHERAEQEAQRADAAEAEIARLRAQLDALQKSDHA